MKIKNLIIILWLAVPAKLLSQVNTENGALIPVHGQIKVLLVWAKVTSSFTFTSPSPVAGYGMGPLPADANDFFDPAFTPGVEPTAYLSKYFYQASFGNYVVLGDYLNHVIEVPSGGDGYNVVYSYLNSLHGLGLWQPNLSGSSNLTDFDQYTTNFSTDYLPKAAAADNKIDAVVILWTNHPSFVGGGHGMQNHGYLSSSIGPFTGVYADCAFADFGGENAKKFIVQEYFHGMFGGNDWHTGAGAGKHTFMTVTNPWGIPTQTVGAGVSNRVNGWDRNHLGWYGWVDKNQTIPKSNLISAVDQTGTEIQTDFTINSSLGSGLFVLRDHVLYGDAIRIKLPHLQDDPAYAVAKNQYLWIENHQKFTTYDKGQWEDLTCKELTEPGMWAYIQVGKENKGQLSSTIDFVSATNTNGCASWIFPLTAEGNYDWKYLNPHQPTTWPICNWNNRTVEVDRFDPTTIPNPFIGYSDLFNYYNSNGDNKLLAAGTGNDQYQPGSSERLSGTTVYNGHSVGDAEDAFNMAFGKEKISISTNPASTPVYTYMTPALGSLTPNINQHNVSYENRSIWLNGVSVEIIQENYNSAFFGPGAILIKVRFDDYDVNQPVRWCGNIKVSPNDFDPTPSDFSDNMYAVNVVPGGSILLDRSRSYTRHYAIDQDPITNEWRFSEPTEMTVLPNAYFHMENGTSIVVDGESTLRIKNNGRLEVHDFGTITVKKGSKLILESGAQLSLHDNALVKIEEGGVFEYDNSSITLAGNNSVIEFEGTLELVPNSEFTFGG